MKTDSKHHSGTGTVYPDSPRAAAGAIVFNENKVLLVLRGQAPAEKMWAIPCGSVNLGETLQAAAEREIYEETGIVIKAGMPVFTFDVIVRDNENRVQFHYVIVDLIADYVSGELRPGDDVLDARWVSAQEMQALKLSLSTRELLKKQFNFG